MPERHDRYPTDLSDAEWAVLERLLPPPSRLGRPRKGPRRLMAEAIFHLVRSGCAWRMLPRDYPPWRGVYSRFARWRRDGTLRRAHDGLRAMAREASGREAEPSAGILDSQTARCTGVGGPARGYDGAKRAAGRKRHVLVDTLGLVRLAHVHAADLRDGLGARELAGRATPPDLPRLGLVRADRACAGGFARWLEAERGWRLEVPKHRDRHLRRYGLEERPRGFRVLPRRWGIERTFAWLSRSPAGARLRAPAGDRRGHDPRRDEPDHAPQAS